MLTTTLSYGYDEQAILLQASTGDLEAYNQLVKRYEDLAYRHAYTLVGDPDLAADATQESFIKAFQAINTFRGGSFRAWLLRIVTNSAYDLFRRFRRQPTRTLFPEGEDGEEMESPSWIADPAASVQAIVEQNEFTRDIYRTLAELPAVYRTVLTLVDVHELEYQEAARALNVPVGTVKSRLARARLQMKQRLEGRLKYEGQPGGTQAGLAA
jgi:RNA polymerase sigma-70 factor, ECF subfamily